MFTKKVCEQLGYYVYLYIDPRDESVFYVGKGRSNRCFSHLNDTNETEKTERIRELRELGQKPRIEILKYGLTDEEALLVESTAIDLLDVKKLTNRVRGFGSRAGSRGSTSEIQATLGAQRVEITHPGVLININRTFRPNMDVIDLYDATRSAWKIGRRREAIRFAFSVYGAVIREIFLIEAWVRGGATLHAGDINGRPTPRPGRWEFVGRVADDDVRDRYLGRSVAHYFSIGSANPIRYVGDV